MNLRTAIAGFLLACGADGLREKTLIWYESLLKKFWQAFESRELETITPNEIRAYLVDLRAQNYSEDTVHGHTRALHRFWRWYSKEFGIPNPMRNIAYPQQPKPKNPKAVKVEDVVRMLEVCDQSFLGRRDKSIIAFLADSAGRAGELCGLQLPDLDMDRMRAYVTGKGGKRKVLMFTETTAVLLVHWLAVRKANPGVDNLFVGRRGKPLKPNGLLQMTIRLRKRARITGRSNPHAFRHGFAIEYLLNGGDLATLSRILGHESIEVTARFYGVFVQDELRQMHRKHTPMNKIKSVQKKDDPGTL